MNTLDNIRRENMYLLRSVVGGSVGRFVLKVEANRTTISSMFNGRKITEKYARLIEKGFKKPVGWLDEEHSIDTEIQYDKEVIQYAFNCIYSVKAVGDLFERLEVEGKTDLFDKLYVLFTDPVARELAPSTLLNILTGETDGSRSKVKD